MVIYIASDHQGFELKENLKNFLKAKGYQVADLGNNIYDENDDYPDFAEKVAKKISIDYEQARGIVVCAAGVGVDIVANKFQNVRCALAANSNQAYDSRNDDDTNVLALAAEYLKPEEANKIVTTWLETPFSSEEKFRRRLHKIADIESRFLRPVIEDEE